MVRYQQAGTPKLEVSTSYDSSARAYTIRTKQSNANPSAKQPVMLPVDVALFDRSGQHMNLKLKVRFTGCLLLSVSVCKHSHRPGLNT